MFQFPSSLSRPSIVLPFLSFLQRFHSPSREKRLSTDEEPFSVSQHDSALPRRISRFIQPSSYPQQLSARGREGLSTLGKARCFFLLQWCTPPAFSFFDSPCFLVLRIFFKLETDPFACTLVTFQTPICKRLDGEVFSDYLSRTSAPRRTSFLLAEWNGRLYSGFGGW